MLLDSSTVDLAVFPKSEVLVVGSGPVGLALAVALEKLGVTVTILEAGGYIANEHAQSDLVGDCSGAALPGLVVGRTRQIGGGLNLWGGQLALLDDDDILRDDAQQEMRWPLTRDDLYGGVRDVMEILGSDKIDFGRMPALVQHENVIAHRYGLKLFQTGWLRSPKLSRAFWKRLRQTKAITLIHGLACVGLDYDTDAALVTGVAVSRCRGQRFSLNARTIVLAAGSIENARLLRSPLLRASISQPR